MADFSARVLYTFSAEGGTELNISEGEIITVLNSEVGDGWWYGRNAAGVEGMFPASYVEPLTNSPAEYLTSPVDSSSAGDTWSGVPGHVTAPLATSNDSWGMPPQFAAEPDDWSSEDESVRDTRLMPPPPPLTTTTARQHLQLGPKHSYGSSNQAPSRPLADGGSYFALSKLGLGKSGAVENYLTGAMEAAATSSKEAILVVEVGPGRYAWSLSGEPYIVTVGVAKKGAKFGGLKAYMNYPLTPSFSNIQVLRRYKHFDWLHERLTAKYGAVVALPPLPEKQVTGRFEEELIETRRVQLQSFASRISRHPVLSESHVWRHFISETEDKRWTNGKRRAESDTLVGVTLLTTIQAPETGGSADEIAQFGLQMPKMENAVKHLYGVAVDQCNKQRGVYRKDLDNIGKAFHHLGQSLENEVACLPKIGDCFLGLGSLCEEQSSRDWEPVQHMMHDYRGLTASWSAVLTTYSSIADRQREMEQSAGDKEKLASRTRIHNYRMGVLAEKTFFKEEIEADLQYTCQNFVREQIAYHRQMAERLEALYRHCWQDGGAHTASTADAAAAAAPNQTPSYAVPAGKKIPTTNRSVTLDAWGAGENIYEEMP